MVTMVVGITLTAFGIIMLGVLIIFFTLGKPRE